MRNVARTSFLSTAVAVVALIQASAAHATFVQGTTVYASDNGGGPSSPNSAPLSIPVTASVGTACGTTTLPTTTVNVGELNATLNTQVALTIKCTGSFRMGVVSANGGLVTTGIAPAGYTTLRDYNVSLHIIDDTLAANDSSTCAASTLTAGSTSCLNLIGPATTSAPTFKVPTSSNNQTGSYLLISGAYTGTNILVAGPGYTDTLTITLTSSP